MGLKREIWDGFLDKFGYVMPRRNHGVSDNGVLFTSQYILLLQRLGQLDGETKAAYFNLMRNSFRDTGLLIRYPENFTQEGPDDHIGISAASLALELPFAKEIIDYGRKQLPPHLYNTENPGKWSKQAWLGRQLGLIGFMKLCAGYGCNPLEKLAMIVGFYLTSRKPKEDTSDRLLTQVMVEALPKGLVNDLIKKWWHGHINKLYGDVRDLVSIYFGPDHPFSRYWVLPQ